MASVPSERPAARRRLLDIAEVPPHAKRAFYPSGYPSGPPRLSLLFELHNETANVWSHLLPAIMMLGRLLDVVSNPDAPLVARSYVAVFEVTALFCFTASAMAHAYGAGTVLPPRQSAQLWSVDLMGISAVAAGAFVPGLRWGFRCWPRSQAIYALASVSLVITAVLNARAPIGSAGNRRFIVAIVTAACLGMIAFVHWVSFASRRDLDDAFLPTLGMFTWFAIGFWAWKRQPFERLGAHKNPLYLGSHTAWHAAIAAGVACWDSACRVMLTRDWDTAHECRQ